MYLWVGEAWQQELECGFRDPSLECATGGEGYCMGVKTLKNGLTVMDCETEDCFSVDLEGAWFCLEPGMGMLESFLDTHKMNDCYSTAAYIRWASLGIIQVAKGKEGVVDKILRRSVWKHNNGLGPGVSYKDVLKSCISVKPVQKEDDPKDKDELKSRAPVKLVQKEEDLKKSVQLSLWDLVHHTKSDLQEAV
jgi:hypothetical protein